MNDERTVELKRIFADFTDTDMKWKYLIDLGKQTNNLDKKYKTEENLVYGCSTTMYLVPEWDGRLLKFLYGAEVHDNAPLISMGLAALATWFYGERTPGEILAIDRGLFHEIGLDIGLTPTRNNGFASILDKIYRIAKIYNVIFEK